jgi:endogenous inhibitor of DNA gyrase (YacG/DUF329 family)
MAVVIIVKKILLCLLIISITPSIYCKNNTMVEKVCLNCGGQYKVIDSRKDKAKFCSKECANIQLNGEKNTVCTECGESFHLKESSKRRYKRTQGYFCSTKCVADFRKKAYIGINNPNFRNAETSNGYLLEQLPKFGRIKLHHKVVFEYLNINEIPHNYCIHHRDCQINNNDKENLALLTGSDHRWLHKNFGNATLWAYVNNRISLKELCSWCKNPEKAMKLLPFNIITQKELIIYENS